jgi:hypothetical protein
MRVTVFADQAPLIIFIGIALELVGAAAMANLQSSKTRHERVRRRASWIAAFVSGVVALFATLGFGMPVLESKTEEWVSG